MALFNLPYINHGEAPLMIQDLVSYVRLALIEAGHDVYVGPFVEPQAINILIEGFSEATTNILLAYASMGVKIVIIASEVVTGGTFNDFKTTDNGAARYAPHRDWDERYWNFLKVAEACKTVWCLCREQLKGYAEVLPPSWLHHLPFGYVSGYGEVQQLPPRLKDIDFIFTGSSTGYRERIMKELERKGFRIMSRKHVLPSFFRANLVARAKICLGLKHYKEWKYSSLLRNYYHLMNGCFMLAESCEIPSVVDDYIEKADPDTFISACVEAQKRPDLGELAAQNLDRYRQEVPLKPLFAALLEQSLAT